MVVAKHEGIERGEKLRADTTNIDTNIHEPTGSSLLGDANRVLVRLMKRARKEYGIKFSTHGRRAKKRVSRFFTRPGSRSYETGCTATH